jgi:hypothetical protein
MRKPIEDRITIPEPTIEEIFEKYKCCLNDIKRYLEIEDYTPEQRFALIKYSVNIALDDNIKIVKFKDVEIKNAGDTVHIQVDLEKE